MRSKTSKAPAVETPEVVEAPKARAMFMDTLNIEAGKDLVHIGLMDLGPDGERPEKDGETHNITVPLSQFGPLLDDFRDAYESPENDAFCKERASELDADALLPAELEEFASHAYHAYGSVTGWKNFRGEPMPSFEVLPETIRKAWEASVKATIEKMDEA